MNIDFKELLRSNVKALLFLGGIMVGSLLSMFLMHWIRNVKLVELDLNRIIKAYSLGVAKSNKSPGTINKEFKDKFNHAMEQMSPKYIVVTKGHLLSAHEASDGTKQFIDNMGLNTIDEQRSN